MKEKWSSLLARTRALILYIWIWIFDFGPEKLPGLSRNGPLAFRQKFMLSLLRLEPKHKKNSPNPSRIRTFLFRSYSSIIWNWNDTDTFIHSRSSLKNHTRFQTKMGKVNTRFQTKTDGGGRGGYTLFWRRIREKRDLANWLVATLLAAPSKQYITPTLIKLQNYLSYLDFTSMVY